MSLPTAILSAFLGSFLLAGALTYLRAMPDSPRGVGWWATAFWLSTLRYALYLVQDWLDPTVVLVIAEWTQALVAVFVLAGTLLFVERRISWLFVGFVAVSAPIWIVLTFRMDPLVLYLPLYTLSGGVMVLTGVHFIRAAPGDGRAGYFVTGGGFIVWGLHKLNYPFLRPIEWLAPYGFLFAYLLAITLAVGLIVITQQSLVLRAKREAERRATAEHEFHDQLDFIQKVIDAVPLPVFYKDTSGIFLGCNKAYERFFGVSRARIVGCTLRDFFPSSLTPTYEAADRELYATGGTQVYEIYIPNASGEKRDLVVHKAIFHKKDGRTGGIVGAILDVTDRNRIQAARDQALAAAEQASQAKSEFLATMSHEFRTPLNAILGFSEMMQSQYFGPLGSETYKEYADAIHMSGDHMLELVNDLLDISAIEAGKRNFQTAPIDIAGLIEDCTTEFDLICQEKEIALEKRLTEDPPEFMADERSIRQIVMNLLSNAVKFTRLGGHITVEVSAENDAAITIAVTDTGIGIPADKLATITDPFVRVDPNPLTANEGSGLGLAIVRRLVDLHQGRLHVQSTFGEGTTVMVTFPIENGDHAVRPTGTGGNPASPLS